MLRAEPKVELGSGVGTSTSVPQLTARLDNLRAAGGWEKQGGGRAPRLVSWSAASSDGGSNRMGLVARTVRHHQRGRERSISRTHDGRAALSRYVAVQRCQRPEGTT